MIILSPFALFADISRHGLVCWPLGYDMQYTVQTHAPIVHRHAVFLHQIQGTMIVNCTRAAKLTEQCVLTLSADMAKRHHFGVYHVDCLLELDS
jgi:hypothetical protein